MATSSISGGVKPPEEPGGKDTRSLGPSDSSDSGSDTLGVYSSDELASDSDAAGTGERATVDHSAQEENSDILPHLVRKAEDDAQEIRDLAADEGEPDQDNNQDEEDPDSPSRP